MKMEDFKYEDPDKYIKEKYVLEDKDYILLISEDIFDEETVQYANEIVNKYQKEKEMILQYLLEKGLRSFYNRYSDEYIKSNIGRPQITIDGKNDNNPNLKYKYMGIIDFVGSTLDEHIISIEFLDDLQLYDSVQIDG